MNYIKITKHDIANGDGIRVVLWVSGCSVHCKGCHNPQTWDFSAGQPFDSKAKAELITALSQPWIKGLTLSGGNPLEEEHCDTVYELTKEVKQFMPEKDIWVYTGFNFADLSEHQLKALDYTDILVDGKFEESLKDISLRFRGSSNQQIIDLNELRTMKMMWLGLEPLRK